MGYNANSARAFLETAHEALMDVRRVERRIEILQSKREYYNKIKLPRQSPKRAKLLRELDDAVCQLLGEVRKARRHYDLVADFISRMDVPKHREILRLRYLEGASLSEIGSRMFFSGRSVGRIQHAALEAADALWEQTRGGGNESD